MGILHHLNVGCADCSVIVSSNYTFIVDCYGLENYSHLLPKNKNLKAVFITHQHHDHFDGLSFLKDNDYSIEHLIYSPYERRYDDNSVEYEEWQDFEKYKKIFTEKGTKLYSPYRQEQLANPWWKIDGLKFFILGPMPNIAKSETRELHDASLVIHLETSSRKCLFTGDASDASLRYIAWNTRGICDDILHASHHGSLNGADIDFIKHCNASYTVISTKSGVHENVPHPDALQVYRENTSIKVYRTDEDGSLEWSF
ncbi:MAG: MBL fold metallo-hydrolase [Nitrospiraceae bacterium]|nr:MBL fold metallo-hydrolase [Nitrospiraceae bacterium]